MIRIGIVIGLFGVLVGCTAEAPPAPIPEGLTPGLHGWTTADGNSMPYEVGGKEDAATTVVFIHCWMCERGFWDAQLPALAADYRTITLDLPGHGAATAAREVWSVAQFGDDVAGLLHGLDLRDVVLVGHSMGGPVALRAAALTDRRVVGIVAVDTLHDAEYTFDGTSLFKALEMTYPGVCEKMVRQMVPEPDGEPVIERILAAGCTAERGPVGAALMRDFASIDLARWMQEAAVPIRAINAGDGRPTETERNRTYADFDAVLVDDVGHYLHMTRPATFNPLLVDAVRELAGDA